MAVIDVKKDTKKLIIKVFTQSILAAVLNLVIFMSIIMMITAISTKTLGKYVYEVIEEGGTTATSLITYIPAETSTTEAAEDTAASSSETSGTLADDTSAAQTSDTRRIVEIPDTTPLSGFASAAMNIIALFFTLTLFLALPYSALWTQGDKDANHVQFGHMERDNLRGLKIGAIASLPSLISFALLVMCKLSILGNGALVIYKFANTTFWPLLNLLASDMALSNNIENVSYLTVAIMLLVQVLPALICHISYTLGYKHISISEKLIYKNPNKKRRR